jgi:DNA-binding FadR family transcriptional regulator
MYENMIPALATATGIACLQLTSQHITTIENAVEQGTRLPRSPGWEHKATVHAEIFSLLAEAVDYPAVAGVLSLGAEIVRDLAITSGPAADGIIINSHQRLLAHLRARDANAAEHEMEELLKCLHTMWRLTGRPRARTAEDPGDRRQPAAALGPRSSDPASLPGHDDQILIPTEEL